MTEAAGSIATIIAVAGVLLNNRRRRSCFLLWLVSNAISLAIRAHAGIWSLAARDAIFLLLALEGLRLWGREVGH